MSGPPGDPPAPADLLAVLRSADGALTIRDLRAAGVDHPARAIYELQLSGHRIIRTAGGHALYEDRGAAAPSTDLDPPPAA